MTSLETAPTPQLNPRRYEDEMGDKLTIDTLRASRRAVWRFKVPRQSENGDGVINETDGSDVRETEVGITRFLRVYDGLKQIDLIVGDENKSVVIGVWVNEDGMTIPSTDEAAPTRYQREHPNGYFLAVED